jgi:hypothetical protein
LVTTLTGASGVLAAGSDRATTGTNSLETGSIAASVNLQIARWDRLSGACGTFTDDLTTGLFTLTDRQPSSNSIGAPQDLCLRNAGQGTINVSVSAIDVVSTDIACTGDEASVDDTCGADQAGELGTLVTTRVDRWSSCAANAPFGSAGISGPLASFGPGAIATGLAPGATTCVLANVVYNPSAANAEKGQSDRVTWRYAFDAVPAA